MSVTPRQLNAILREGETLYPAQETLQGKLEKIVRSSHILSQLITAVKASPNARIASFIFESRGNIPTDVFEFIETRLKEADLGGWEGSYVNLNKAGEIQLDICY